MFEILKEIICVFTLYICIALMWQFTEKIMYGQITPRLLDDYVAIVLAISLYFNMK